MRKNRRIAAKIIRLFIALSIIGLYFTTLISGTIAIILLFTAGMFILTSLPDYYLLNSPFGISIQKKEL